MVVTSCIPTIGYPMNAYIDAARRAHYPEGLLNLTTAGDVEHALRNIDMPEERDYLHHAAKRGGCLSSPWYSGLELLSAICSVGRSYNQPLQPVAATLPDFPPATSNIKRLCGREAVSGRRKQRAPCRPRQACWEHTGGLSASLPSRLTTTFRYSFTVRNP